ncbi:MAG TPA: hypothetical protein VGD91_12735 [Trebonia sp.]
MRLRLPNVLVRVGESHASVRDDQKRGPGRWWWLPSWTFAAVTQAPALLAVAWLVPGTALLLAGRVLPTPMVIIFVPLAVALCYFAMRRLPVTWPRAADPAPPGPGRRADVPAAALLAALAVAAGFGVWQAVFGSEQVFVASDPGVYLQYGYWIAEHGTARIPESAGAFGGAGGLNFATTGFAAAGGSLIPGYLPGLPLLLAAGTWLHGLSGALLTPAVLGGAAVLSFGGLVGRLCGAWWAVAAELVLALSLPEVYASRTPFSEPLVQVLLFGGLCLFTDSLVVRRRGFVGLGGFGGFGEGVSLAGLGGFALGLTVLVNIGSLGALLPAFPLLAVLFVTRRPQAGPFGVGLVLGLGTGLAVGLILDRPYLSTVSAQLHLISLCAAGFGILTALVAPLAFPGARARLRRVCGFRPRLRRHHRRQLVLPSLGTVLAWTAAALPVLALAFLAARPHLQTVRGQTNPAVIRHVASLQRLEGSAIDGTRQYYESSLYWVLWYLGLPAALLACAGAALLARRSVCAVLGLRWPDGASASHPGAPVSLAGPPGSPDDVAPLWALPFLLVGWSVATVLWDPSVVPWQPLAVRRLVPVVLPGLLLFGVWAASRLTSRASVVSASRAATVLAGTCCVLALSIPPLVTTLNPALTARPTAGPYSSGVAKFVSRVHLRGVGASATYGGSVAAARSLCAAIGPSASVLFTDASAAAVFAPVVRDFCGQPAAFLTPPASPPSAAAFTAELGQAVRSVERTGRRPVLLGSSSASVALSGLVPRPVVSLSTAGDAEVLDGPPGGNWAVVYSLWLSAPVGSGG